MSGLALDAVRVMNRNWRTEGYTSPNLETYPWQWLWDSCFHALVWAALGDRRATIELENVFAFQRSHGFVPHVGYQHDPHAAEELWGIHGSSTITQPPMYAHAARGLAAAGMPPSRRLLQRIEAALEHLWEHRRASNGLVSCFHPWEGGTDDSPRWDRWSAGPFDRFGAWKRRKLELVSALELDDQQAAMGSRQFVAQPASFNAVTAFNLEEIASLTGSGVWKRRASELTEALEQRWDPDLATWTDAAETDHPASSVRTVEALLGALVSSAPERLEAVWRQVFDQDAFGAPFGPAGVHRSEPAFDPDAYWRGASWPQITYLLRVAASRHGRDDVAHRLGSLLRVGASASGHAEHWNPDTGEGGGAAPQSWTTLWLLTVAGSQDP